MKLTRGAELGAESVNDLRSKSNRKWGMKILGRQEMQTDRRHGTGWACRQGPRMYHTIAVMGPVDTVYIVHMKPFALGKSVWPQHHPDVTL